MESSKRRWGGELSERLLILQCRFIRRKKLSRCRNDDCREALHHTICSSNRDLVNYTASLVDEFQALGWCEGIFSAEPKKRATTCWMVRP